MTVEEDDVEHVSWSEDGQLLGVVTHSGTIYIYISQLPIIWSVFNTHAAVLTSLTELTVCNCEVSLYIPDPTVYSRSIRQ